MIRSFTHADSEEVAAHANNPNVARYLRDRFPEPYTVQSARRWISYCMEQEPESNFAIVVDKKVVGGIGFEPGGDVDRYTGEFGYWLGEAAWGRGIATTA
ncbi:MAG: GNAT family N-acetyltransferase, partial [Candidatus Eremiobacteraeota bacterium]|nr:GNAT family N-acetyltransferase [Candidatus Eremiobacteraeota bacterium]